MMKPLFLPFLFIAMVGQSLWSRNVISDIAVPVTLQPGDSLTIDTGDVSALLSQSIEAGIALPKASGKWMIRLNGPDTMLTVNVSFKEKNFGDFDHTRVLAVTVATSDSILADYESDSGINTHKRANFLRATTDGQTMTFEAGNHLLHELGSVKINGFYDSATIKAIDRPITIVRHTVANDVNPSAEPFIDPEEIRQIVNLCDDPNAAIWKYIDEETDRDFARRGGEYIIATLPYNDGYKIVYISGATVYSRRWHSGMTKGSLRPSGLEGNYDLDWIGADFKSGFDGANAVFEGNTLILYFPVDRARLRFVRIK